MAFFNILSGIACFEGVLPVASLHAPPIRLLRHVPIPPEGKGVTATAPQPLDLRQVIAMGVGAMVGGGIFSVLGIAMLTAGHAAPLAFALGGVIALLTGNSYARLGLAFRSDGGSFTYLERAFRSKTVALLGGWLLLAGYVGTMALYAFTFGMYGAAMLGGGEGASAMHHLLQSLVLLVFLAINLYGVREAGNTELVIVTIKVLILALFAVIGVWHLEPGRLVPLFDRGVAGVVMAAALIFVAYEGFELIPNAIHEMEDPQRNLARGIFWSIAITIALYVLVAIVAVGTLTTGTVQQYQEYALAVAAKPFLGQAGFLFIGLAAVLSTASAINATLFGTARLASEMARSGALPPVFAFRRCGDGIPWVSLLVITGVTLLFVNAGTLTLISSFASSTFLLLFLAINLSALRLRHVTGGSAVLPLAGMVLSAASWVALMLYLGRENPVELGWIVGFYAAAMAMEGVFRVVRRFGERN